MKRFTTGTSFLVLSYDDTTGKLEGVKTKDGKVKEFKTRAAVEKYCKANGYMYVEQKFIFYR